jgi:hypothetical protein
MMKNSRFMFLFPMIAISLLSIFVSTMATQNAQAYSSGSLSAVNNNSSSNNGVTQMGICEVGAGGPCDGR